MTHPETITASERAEPSNTGTVFEPSWTLAPLPVAQAVPEKATRLSGKTLVDDRRSWQSDDSAVGGQSANHKKWVRQKIIEGGF
jgi:hypothetical protein